MIKQNLPSVVFFFKPTLFCNLLLFLLMSVGSHASSSVLEVARQVTPDPQGRLFVRGPNYDVRSHSTPREYPDHMLLHAYQSMGHTGVIYDYYWSPGWQRYLDARAPRDLRDLRIVIRNPGRVNGVSSVSSYLNPGVLYFTAEQVAEAIRLHRQSQR